MSTQVARTHRPYLSPGGHFLPVVGHLTWRSLLNIRRMPSAFIPSIVMPVFFVIAFSGAFSAITNIPGFATDNILNWYVPMAVLQGAAFAGLGTGFATARDLEGGFFDRLLLAPTPRATIMIGALAASVVRAFFVTVLVIMVGFAGGATVPGGPAAVVMLLLAASGVAFVAGAWGLGLVYRIKSQSAGPLIQVGIFITLFLSTAQVPLAVMQGWLHAVARVNPMTNILALARQGYLGDVSWGQTWPGLVALAAAGVVLIAFAVRGLKRLVP
jgi:ABC-2 type transport system permease protein